MNPRARSTLREQAAGASAPVAAGVLENLVGDLELSLVAMRRALQQGDSAQALDAAVAQLAVTVNQSQRMTAGSASPESAQLAPFRERLRLALAELQAQREALARASVALEQAAAILIPAEDSAYDAKGQGSRARLPGGVSA